LLVVLPAFAIAGFILLLAALIDINWTTLGTHGGGPLSKHVASAQWKLAVALHRRKPNHRLLSFAGSVILLNTVIFWIALMWIAWVLIYSAHPQSIIDAHTRRPVDLASRIYFVAYTMSTMGNGDFQPNGTTWRVITSVATFGGLGSVTLSITFLIDVIAAVVHKRVLASYVSDLGSKPQVILERSWTGEKLESLDQHLVQITGMIHVYTEQHLAYPVLHCFHSEGERTASTLHVARIHDLMLLLCKGIHPDKRLPRIVTEPLREAIDGFTTTMAFSDVKAAAEPRDPPSLEILRSLGIPTVGDAEFAEAVEQERDVRKFLRGLLRHDGWTDLRA
jgi:hypothetical protein